MFDTKIIQHATPLDPDAKPYHQKINKIHLSLEPLIKIELNKLLDVKIIFLVWHSNLVANLVPVHKKNRDLVMY